jgi:hypothetical protein
MALRAKADDGDGLAVQESNVAVGIVILLDRHGNALLFVVDLFSGRNSILTTKKALISPIQERRKA